MSLHTHKAELGYGDHCVINRISIAIAAKKVTALVGPNGCGKSTLLKGLAGLLPARAGEIYLEERLIGHWRRQQLALKVAFLPQQPLVPEGIKVRQLVALGRFPHQGIFQRGSVKDHEVIQWAMAKTGVSDFADRAVAELSGGEQQRVWIAMAIAQQTPILLLDEPTTYLDWGHQLEVLELLQQLNRDEGLTVVMSLHDLNQAAHFSHHIIAMQQGALVAEGAPQTVLSTAFLRTVFRVDAEVLQCNGKPVCVAKGTVTQESSR